MKKNNKLKLFIGIFICLFIISSISSPLQNVLGEEEHQDDYDIGAVLNNSLETDSSEINDYSFGSAESLISAGTYNFYETPNLDVGSFSHCSHFLLGD